MSKGYKVKTKGVAHSHKLPLFCPHCKRPTGTIDNDYLRDVGFCKLCFTMNVEERKTPIIDLLKYAPPGGLFFGMTKKEIDSCF